MAKHSPQREMFRAYAASVASAAPHSTAVRRAYPLLKGDDAHAARTVESADLLTSAVHPAPRHRVDLDVPQQPLHYRGSVVPTINRSVLPHSLMVSPAQPVPSERNGRAATHPAGRSRRHEQGVTFGSVVLGVGAGAEMVRVAAPSVRANVAQSADRRIVTQVVEFKPVGDESNHVFVRDPVDCAGAPVLSDGPVVAAQSRPGPKPAARHGVDLNAAQQPLHHGSMPTGVIEPAGAHPALVVRRAQLLGVACLRASTHAARLFRPGRSHRLGQRCARALAAHVVHPAELPSVNRSVASSSVIHLNTYHTEHYRTVSKGRCVAPGERIN